MDRQSVVAWVESPLQLVGAAEWGDAHGRRVPVAGRLTPQMSETADALIARGAAFADLEPYLGIPWKMLSQHRHWLVGDGFSGQFRLAASVLRPRRITFLDDGAHALPFADAVLGTKPYARPHVAERGLTTHIAPFALATIQRAGHEGRAGFFTAFDFGAARRDALEDRGFAIERHGFSWTRSSAPVPSDLGTRIVLGSARAVDGRMPLPHFVDWVRAVAAQGAATYLPHRREPESQLAEIAAIPGIRVVRTALPVELVLAGADRPLDVFTLPSSTTTTLPLVLAGTGLRLRRAAAAPGVEVSS